MTLEDYEKRYQELERQKIRSMHLDFKGQNPIEFLKIDVVEVEINRDSFRWQGKWKKVNNKWKKEETIVDWHKDFILDIGAWCGVEKDVMLSKSTKLSKYSYLSECTVKRLMPSGVRQPYAGDYELDSEIRGESAILKNQIALLEYKNKVSEWENNGRKGDKPEEVTEKYGSTAKQKLVVTEGATFGRQIADTGANKRAIIKALKIKSPKEEYIGMVVFCFQCIPNMQNNDMRNMILNNNNPAADIYGNRAIEDKNTIIHKEPVQAEEVKTEKKKEPVKTEESLAVDVEARLNDFQDHPAIVKLGNIILEKNYGFGDFLAFLDAFNDWDDNGKAGAILMWVAGYAGIKVPKNTEPFEVKSKFLAEWVKK